ncbi:MAG: cation:proton antiporter [Betaproteobacteria bacterium]
MPDVLLLPELPAAWPGFITLALLIVSAIVGGELGARAGVPRLVGQSMAGLVFSLGNFGLARLGLEPVPPEFTRITLGLATALVLFEFGRIAPWGWLRRNVALLFTSVLEASLSFMAVLALCRAADWPWLSALLAASVCMASAPTVALALRRELRPQGQVGERVLLLSGLNFAYAVVLSTLLLAWVHVDARGALDAWVLHPLYLIVGSLVVAWAGAWLLRLLLRLLRGAEAERTALTLAIVGLTFAVTLALGLSPLLGMLALGGLTARHGTAARIPGLDTLIGVALVAAFSLTFAAAEFSDWPLALGLAALVTVARLGAKVAAVTVLALPAGLAPSKGARVGLALAPMSAPALLLVQEVAAIDAPVGAQVGSVLLVVVLLMQTAGAMLAAHALRASGECGAGHGRA